MSENNVSKGTFSKLLRKEIKLSSSPLSFIFIAFSLMTFIPGYPITIGSFFICLGLFYTFQNGREANDIIYSVLLPIAKKDVVKARYIFVCFIQMISIALMLTFTLIRMTVLKDAEVYVNNPLQNANLFYIAFCLIVFLLFNMIFVQGFYKTGYYFAKPFIAFIVAAMLVVGLAEAFHYIPGLEFVSETGFVHKRDQLYVVLTVFMLYILGTILSCRNSQAKFEHIDL